MVIAVDFDGTIVENCFPGIGQEFPDAVDNLIRLQKEEHHRIILWTVREDELLESAVKWCEERGLKFYAVNKNNPEEKIALSRKIIADLYIDDLNLGGLPDWNLIYEMIKADKPGRNYETIYRSAFKLKEKAFLKRNFLLRLGAFFEGIK